MARQKFENKRFTAERMDRIADMVRITDRYRKRGQAMTLRQLYYQFIGLDLFPSEWIDVEYNRREGLKLDTKNTTKNYKRLGSLVTDARMAGLLDWDVIDDRGRRPSHSLEFDDLNQLVATAVGMYRLPRWDGQEKHIEVWVEKDALSGVLQPLCREYHITLMANKGYSSSSAMYAAAQRLKEYNIEDVIILYLGDHDPSGEDMVRDVRDRLSLFAGEPVCVQKIGLTMEQIVEHNLPPNPAKVTDSRATAYIEKHGPQSWELDALDIDDLTTLVRESVEQYIDQELVDEIKEREEEDKEKLVEMTKTL